MVLQWARVEYVFGKGRGMIATRDLAPGDLIMEEEPFVAGLFPAHLNTHSSYTFQPCDNLMKCLHCGWPRYKHPSSFSSPSSHPANPS